MVCLQWYINDADFGREKNLNLDNMDGYEDSRMKGEIMVGKEA